MILVSSKVTTILLNARIFANFGLIELHRERSTSAAGAAGLFSEGFHVYFSHFLFGVVEHSHNL